MRMRELRTTEKLIITVATTGQFQGKEVHPKFPEQPDEIAEAVYESWNEGAAIAHIHARDPAGKSTNNPDIFHDIDRRIRDKGCDIIIQHSTAADYIPHFPKDKIIKAIEMNPEMASLDLIPWSRVFQFRGEEKIALTTMDDIVYGAKTMLERNIKPEVEIFTGVAMEDLYSLIEKGALKKPLWINFVFGMRNVNKTFMNFSPDLLMFLINLLPKDSMFNVMGISRQQLPATSLSILLGGNVRVGFEDNIYYRRGELAQSNAQLVARAVRIAKELGCHIATPSEGRDLLGIPQLKKVVP